MLLLIVLLMIADIYTIPANPPPVSMSNDIQTAFQLVIWWCAMYLQLGTVCDAPSTIFASF